MCLKRAPITTAHAALEAAYILGAGVVLIVRQPAGEVAARVNLAGGNHTPDAVTLATRVLNGRPLAAAEGPLLAAAVAALAELLRTGPAPVTAVPQ